MRVRSFGILTAICCVAYGQTGSVAGPSSGYVFDPPAKAVRPIRGIPGAAMMGEAMDLGLIPTSAEVSPRGDLAVAIAEDGSTHVFRLSNGAATERPVNGLMQSPLRVVFSPSGRAAALYRSGSIQVLRGLPDAPEASAAFTVPAAGDHSMTEAAQARRSTPMAIAVSDDGAYLLFGREGAVELLQVSGGTRKLADARSGAVVAFAPGGHDAAVVSGGTLTLFQDVAGASTRQDFPGAGAAGSLAFSADGSKVLMAGPRSVTVLERSTGDRKQVTCECRIAGLAAMGAMFRLNEVGSGPLWLLDPASGEPRVLFVPARPVL